MTEGISFGDGVRSYINQHASTLSTAIPAKILHYNPKTQNAVVKPLIKSLLKDGRLIEYPVLEDVPVMFPCTRASMITFPVNVDDNVLLVFSQRSIDNWLDTKNNEPINPEDFRRHDFSDAIAILGVYSFPTAPNDPSKHKLPHNPDDLIVAHNVGSNTENEIRLGKDGSIKISSGVSGARVTISPNGSVTIDANSTLTVNAPSTTWVGNITQQGTFTSDTDVIAGGISLKTHTHGGVLSGGASTGVPQ